MERQSVRWRALALVLGLAACNPSGSAENMVEEAIEAKTGADVELNAEGDSVTLRGEDGEEMTFTSNAEGIELPSDFPSNVPVYPDARATEYLSADDGIQAGFQIAASMIEVRDWYVEQLKKEEWTIQMNAVMSEGGLLTAEHADQSLQLMFAEEDGETVLIMTLGRK